MKVVFDMRRESVAAARTFVDKLNAINRERTTRADDFTLRTLDPGKPNRGFAVDHQAREFYVIKVGNLTDGHGWIFNSHCFGRKPDENSGRPDTKSIVGPVEYCSTDPTGLYERDFSS